MVKWKNVALNHVLIIAIGNVSTSLIKHETDDGIIVITWSNEARVWKKNITYVINNQYELVERIGSQ